MNKKGQVQAYEILVIILLIGALGGLFWYSFTRTTEAQKAKVINNYNYDQHSLLAIGGCMRVPQVKDVDTKVNSPASK